MPRDPSKPPTPVTPMALPSPPKPSNAVHAGGRPPGSPTMTPVVPGALPGGTPRQTALRSPAPAPTRQGVSTSRDRREQAVPGEPAKPSVEAPAVAKPSVPGLEPQDKAQMEVDAAMRGAVPGVSAEGEPGTAKPVFRLERNIRDVQELETAPVGLFQTPQGTVEKLPGGKIKVRDLSPEAKLKIQEIENREIAQFGDFPGMDDPDGPKPPVKAGMPWFNPFTGQWGTGGIEGEVNYLDDGVE